MPFYATLASDLRASRADASWASSAHPLPGWLGEAGVLAHPDKRIIVKIAAPKKAVLIFFMAWYHFSGFASCFGPMAASLGRSRRRRRSSGC